MRENSVRARPSLIADATTPPTTENVEIEIEISAGYQDDPSLDDQESNFDEVTQLAQELQDKIREDELPTDSGFGVATVVVSVQPSPPAEEPPVIDETQEQETSGQTFSQQSQAADAAELQATTTEAEIAVPTEIITGDFYQIKNTMADMVVRTFSFTLNDQNDEQVTFLETDEWSLEVSVSDGPGSLGANGDSSCTFNIDGFCDISFSVDGDGNFTLTFIVKNSNGDLVETIPALGT